MSVDAFLRLFVKYGTPVTIIDENDNEVDSFVWADGICAWKGNRIVDKTSIEDERLIIKLFMDIT